MSPKVNIFWFRRDLRLEDNTALLEALQNNNPVLPIFIFDTEILEKLPEDDARVSFIYENLQKIRTTMQEKARSSLGLFHGTPLQVFRELVENYEIGKVFTNHDYEPYAHARDEQIRKLLEKKEIEFLTYKDQVIFEKNEVVKKDGKPYLVYTPYKKAWKKKFSENIFRIRCSASSLKNLIQNPRLPNLDLRDIGFKKSSLKVPGFDISAGMIRENEKTRDFPAKETSRLGPHLRFGTISIRKVVEKANLFDNKAFLEELIWREFFMQILYHFPETLTEAFKKKYDRIQWRNNKEDFEKWKKGQTGFPLIDAGMRQLHQTGFLHNRVRMLMGSFLCKHLLIDWRWGEAYFAEKLLDYEMSSNVGNWQ